MLLPFCLNPPGSYFAFQNLAGIGLLSDFFIPQFANFVAGGRRNPVSMRVLKKTYRR
jgi:hypothetical protein